MRHNSKQTGPAEGLADNGRSGVSESHVAYGPLSKAEATRLAEAEAKIDRGKTMFIDVGNALMEIRDQRLYRATHRTFRECCEERHGFKDSRARQLILGAETVTTGNALGYPAPETERQARELRKKISLKETRDEYDELNARMESDPSARTAENYRRQDRLGDRLSGKPAAEESPPPDTQIESERNDEPAFGPESEPGWLPECEAFVRNVKIGPLPIDCSPDVIARVGPSRTSLGTWGENATAG
jgi:hypothetical protein